MNLANERKCGVGSFFYPINFGDAMLITGKQ